MTSVEKAPVAARAVIDSATVDNITRLKAQWQAEALERHAEGIARDNEPTDMVCVEDIQTLLLHEAAKLRRNGGKTHES